VHGLGINIGSSSVKVVLVSDTRVLWHRALAHEGDFAGAVRRALAGLPPLELPEGGRLPALVTGTEGRHLFNLNGAVESLCIEEALGAVPPEADGPAGAMVSLGGEDLVVYTLRNGRVAGNLSGSKCASGTGEFFKQQLARMDMELEEIDAIPASSRVLPISARCSVFMKSDCTHRLNKGEARKEDIVLSLSWIMAGKVLDFLKRARIREGKVLLAGGLTRNRHLVAFLRQRAPRIDFRVPPEAPYFEAYGAALLARTAGGPLPPPEELFRPRQVRFERIRPLREAEGRVTVLASRRGRVRPGRRYILGVDGGSTTTKACLVDLETGEIAAAHYGRTHGDPVRALKECLGEIRRQVIEAIGEERVEIPLAAATGSSREILGVFLETPGVYNEIIAHSVGTTFYREEIDTIFEIGGQDAKYVYLKNRVPVDYAMNEACSAGTGSFLEESAQGDLNIGRAEEIGPIALRAEAPLKFGEHCSAFINSDIRKAIQQGASREDITAGLVASIVSNYLNRVVGNRAIGQRIVLQGGVAKNPAVPLAFALLLDRDILVPPDPELLGCFGVGLLARQKRDEGSLEESACDLEELLRREIVYEREFACRACENRCPIRVLNVNGRRHLFGGRCNRYANIRHRQPVDERQVADYVARRMDLMFRECAPDPAGASYIPPGGDLRPVRAGTSASCRTASRFYLAEASGFCMPPAALVPRREITVGVPRCLSVYTLWPLYAGFFHALGIRAVLSESVDPEGCSRVESTYCFPAEIAHGAVQDLLARGVDYLFLPHVKEMPSYERQVHANFCPITQALPYYIRQAFPEVPQERILAPVISFKLGRAKALEGFLRVGRRLGVAEEEAREAFEAGMRRQEEYGRRAAELGREALEEARRAGRPVIAVLGRPYNAFSREANMGIPRKFTTRGCTVVPFDILPFEDQAIFSNMYWYYGQQDTKAAALIKNEENLFVTFITNFSCAPDSFLLHYLRWTMGAKPFLVLELDSHTADAGVDTRVEAFLDIIAGYRRKLGELAEERYDNGWRFVNDGREEIHLRNERTGERVPVRGNPRVKLLLSNMGNLGAELVAAVTRSAGLQAEALPVASPRTLQIARHHVSGKECVPAHLVLGSALSWFSSPRYRKEELYLVFVPVTTGPCRTGQYFVFLQNLFRDLRLENVVVFTLSADHSYRELGPRFSRYAWWAFVVSDYMRDLEIALYTCAADPGEARRRYGELWRRLVAAAERDIRRCRPVLRRIAREVAALPRRRELADCPRVVVVGEIYVRRDDFAVDELVRLLSRRGIASKISGVGEWVHYLDFVRELELKKRLALRPPLARPFSAEAGQLLRLWLERAYKRSVERRVKQALRGSGLLPEAPEDMRRIMANTRAHFMDHELNSEIAVSSGVAATAMLDGYSGVVNISPFACLIGRVIEGVYTPWARERGYPTLSVEVDGNQLPPNMVNKLEIFLLNVLRFRGTAEPDALIERR
jgi:predicted CoA-substrate-specific enzyme activase